MDQERHIRFAIPPFILFASLLWGAKLGGRDFSPLFQNPEMLKVVLGVLAAATVAVVPVGFLIGTLSIMFLRFLAVITRNPTYEAFLSEETRARIWGQLRSTQTNDKKLTLYVAATFDHELLAAGIHKWLLRRWNTFNVASHSVVALLLAHVVAFIFKMPQVCVWWISSLVLIGLLGVTARNAWCETMAMIDFQSYRPQKSGATGVG